MDIIYTLHVTVIRAVVPDSDNTVTDAAGWMRSSQAKKELEREIVRALRVLDGDCDAEVMETAEVDNG